MVIFISVVFFHPGLIVAVGISNLQYVDLNSSRNLFIIGFAFLVGLSIPEWIKANPHAINTGKNTLLKSSSCGTFLILFTW